MLFLSELPATMQAIEVDAGHQLQFVSRPIPALSQGEVLIKVAAAGVNRADLVQRAGFYPPPPGDSDILGLEVAGTVVAVADHADAKWLGAEVFGLVPGGGYAQYARMPAAHLLQRPAALPVTTAAGFAEVFLTACQAMFSLGGLQANQAVLLHAGASGVGTAAIALAKAAGAYVAVTVGSDDKATACLALGADVAVNYKTTDFVTVLKDAVPQGFQVIVDPVAGDYLPKDLQLLALDGRIVVLAMLGGRTVPAFDLTQMFKKRGQLLCSTLRNRSDDYKTALLAAFMQQFGPHLQNGALSPVIAQVLPWQQADLAHQLLAGNQLVGKVVLTVD
ncbi:NAD(P)H-quinone oxidoreductase [Rheinheimera sp. F8]|uniref:NAD(P)H-quinone oxidoreductase n=1 Tax=Rheinheimera sp. F8 TaxID=1763998 RepID=UPI000744CB0E|nr:NAD(P)H-quinone oxidoreductase [Rheinheimera sp. F8]ALZ77003.1 NADPH quinone oxidoreductase [Rheinheimera sp. F8]